MRQQALNDTRHPKSHDTVKMYLGKKRRWSSAVILAMAVLLLPYVYSRLTSPWRVVAVYSTPNSALSGLDATQFRIASYNIAHGRGVAISNWDGGDREERLARLRRLAELLCRLDADIVVLNEIDFDSSWSHSVNQARFLAEKANYRYWAEQRNLDFRLLTWKWRFGNAVLSRWPITRARVVDLPGYSVWETVLVGKKRGVMCDVILGDLKVRVIGTHFSHRSEALRVRSAITVSDIAGEDAVPIIIAGDLNSTPPGFPNSVSDRDGNNAIAAFDKTAYFQRVPIAAPIVNDELTFHSTAPRSVIDWILIPRDWKILHYNVECSQLSDHRPAYADVEPASSAASVEWRKIE